MKAVELNAKWNPKSEFKLGPKDVDGKLTVNEGNWPKRKTYTLYVSFSIIA